MRAAVWLPLAAAGLAGCLLRPSPNGTSGGDAGGGGGDGGGGSVSDGGAGGADATRGKDAPPAGIMCPGATTIDAFGSAEPKPCGNATVVAGSLSQASGPDGTNLQLSIANNAAASCGWTAVIGKGIAVKMMNPSTPEVSSLFTITSGQDFAEIQLTANASNVQLQFKDRGSSGIMTFAAQPVEWVRLRTAGNEIFAEAGSDGVTYPTPLGNTTFTSVTAPSAVTLGVSTGSSMGTVGFTSFDCIP